MENVKIQSEMTFVKGKNQKLFFKLWEFSIAILFFYVFFFQNAITSFGGIIIMLCGINIAFSILDVLRCLNTPMRFDAMGWIFLFVCVSVFTSFFFSINVRGSLSIGVRMLEYVLAAYSIYRFIRRAPGRFYSVLFYMWLSVALLAVATLLLGTVVTGAGGIGLESLNVNALSSLFLMYFFCTFLLFNQTKNRFYRCLLILFSLVVFVVQVQTASRRGFIVNFSFVFLAIIWCVLPSLSTKNRKKQVVFALLLFLIAGIAIFILYDYILEHTILGLRFLGEFTAGDAYRKKYQEVALEQFFNSPLIGIGLNGIQSLIGVYSHSLYYELLSCTGLVGFLFAITSLVILGIDFLKMMGARRHSIHDVYLLKSGFLFWGCIMASGILVVMIYDFYFYIWIGFLASIIAVFKENKKRDTGFKIER